MTHSSDQDLILHYYGEADEGIAVAVHLEQCAACAAAYRDLAETLNMIPVANVPERGEQYGLEVWQRIRHELPDQQRPWWSIWFSTERLVLAGAAAGLVVPPLIPGRWAPPQPSERPAATGAGATRRSARTSALR